MLVVQHLIVDFFGGHILLYTSRQAGIRKTCLMLNWSTVDMFFIRLSKTYGEEVHRHILKATAKGEEDPEVSLKDCNLTRSSVACWREPQEYDWQLWCK